MENDRLERGVDSGRRGEPVARAVQEPPLHTNKDAEVPALDFTDKFNTQLSPAEERRFQSWLVRNGREKDLYDYDLRGAFRAGAAQDPRGHLPDTFKKPNHPTFSRESQYSNDEYPGGEWVQQGGKWKFLASPFNVQNFGADELRRYFMQVEPGSQLVLPSGANEKKPNSQVAIPDEEVVDLFDTGLEPDPDLFEYSRRKVDGGASE